MRVLYVYLCFYPCVCICAYKIKCTVRIHFAFTPGVKSISSWIGWIFHLTFLLTCLYRRESEKKKELLKQLIKCCPKAALCWFTSKHVLYYCERSNSTWHMQIDISPWNQCYMERAGEWYGFFCFCFGMAINPYR